MHMRCQDRLTNLLTAESEMKFLDSVFSGISKSLTTMKKTGNMYICRLDADDNGLLNKSNEIVSGSISCAGKGGVDAAFNRAISIIPTYSPSVGEVAGERRVRVDVLSLIALKLGYFPFAGENDAVYISTISNPTGNIEYEYQQLDNLFKRFFNCGITLSKVVGDGYCSILEQRINDTYKFYVEERGAWTERFMTQLGDELSRESFRVFLRQRIRTSVFYDRPVCYPVLPPAKTAEWRGMRENSIHEFPVLHGASPRMLTICHKYIYIYHF